jgi:hypothetical protein
VEALRLTSAAAVLLAAYFNEEVVNFDKLFNCRSIKEKKEQNKEKKSNNLDCSISPYN